jgi:hypothetical protein
MYWQVLPALAFFLQEPPAVPVKAGCIAVEGIPFKGHFEEIIS